MILCKCLEVPSNVFIDKNPLYIFLHAFSSWKNLLLSPILRLWSLTQTSLKCLLSLNPWASLGFCSLGSTAALTWGLCAAHAVCEWPLQPSRCHYRKDTQKKRMDFWNEYFLRCSCRIFPLLKIHNEIRRRGKFVFNWNFERLIFISNFF